MPGTFREHQRATHLGQVVQVAVLHAHQVVDGGSPEVHVGLVSVSVSQAGERLGVQGDLGRLNRYQRLGTAYSSVYCVCRNGHPTSRAAVLLSRPCTSICADTVAMLHLLRRREHLWLLPMSLVRRRYTSRGVSGGVEGRWLDPLARVWSSRAEQERAPESLRQRSSTLWSDV